MIAHEDINKTNEHCLQPQIPTIKNMGAQSHHELDIITNMTSFYTYRLVKPTPTGFI